MSNVNFVERMNEVKKQIVEKFVETGKKEFSINSNELFCFQMLGKTGAIKYSCEASEVKLNENGLWEYEFKIKDIDFDAKAISKKSGKEYNVFFKSMIADAFMKKAGK